MENIYRWPKNIWWYKEQQAIYEKIRKEVNYLNEQKQEISKYIQLTISFINTLNNEISYYKGRLDHFKNLNNRNNLSSGFLQPFIFIVLNKGKNKDDEDSESKRKWKWMSLHKLK